jgi:Na+/H+ antiporter NhaD/arsenite permease-like protein
MIRMVPYVAIMIFVAWILLQFFFPFKSDKVVLEIPENKRENDWKSKVVWITFVGTILLWATESITGINSNVVALIPLGVLTCTGIFSKDDIKQINWSVLWLVAGGFALGAALVHHQVGLALGRGHIHFHVRIALGAGLVYRLSVRRHRSQQGQRTDDQQFLHGRMLKHPKIMIFAINLIFAV